MCDECHACGGGRSHEDLFDRPTADIEQIARFKPTDATTNPSLLLKAAEQPKYQHLVQAAVAYAGKHTKDPRARYASNTSTRC